MKKKIKNELVVKSVGKVVTGLDSQQIEIVNSIAENIIVCAGAGSGKTRVLTERVKRLLNEGVEPHNIVAITFTNMASEEMRERLSNVPGIGDAFVGTIHAFAHKIFSNSGTEFEIITQDIISVYMKHLIRNYAKYLTNEIYMFYLDLQHNIEVGLTDENAITEVILPSCLEELGWFYDHETCEEYPENIHTLASANKVITFDELLKESTEYFKSLGARVEYLLVDEFQDIGTLEQQFLIALNAENNFIVGDDWQSIYGFKGGNVRFFLQLLHDPDWVSFYMSNNYRNGKNIIEVAQTVIRQADHIIDKEVTLMSGRDGKVTIESKYNLESHLTKIKRSGKFKDWFFLVRTNKDLFMLGNLLEDMEIPFVGFKKSQTTFEQMKEELQKDAVKLLTIHTAKGLESKNVLLYGNFPIKQQSYLKNSDERKVLYVGITRCEENLIILN
jgi:DNA helicase-2/ATP-dependent DNA helicase PcrA